MIQHELLKRFIKTLVKSDNNSLIIVSPAGYGKTETTLNYLLDEMNFVENKHFRYLPNYATPRGLVDELQEANGLQDPRLLILDDVEDTLRNIRSVGVLKGALWGVPGGDRRVSWITSKESVEFNFKGKIIFLLNEFSKKGAIMNALKDRSMFYEITLTNEELFDLMMERTKRPYENISLPQRVKIAQFIQRVGSNSKRLSLRLLPKAYQMFLVSPNHWQELIIKELN